MFLSFEIICNIAGTHLITLKTTIGKDPDTYKRQFLITETKTETENKQTT